MSEVGIRELRHSLSAVLARVQAGERVVVTSHNRPVAELVPFDQDEDPLARLIEQGLATPPSGPLDFEPIKLGDGGITLSEALARTRGD